MTEKIPETKIEIMEIEFGQTLKDAPPSPSDNVIVKCCVCGKELRWADTFANRIRGGKPTLYWCSKECRDKYG